jgi:hypothetical protein
MLVMRVPQVTCPNCGTTINLENRKEIDLGLIKDAARRQPKTFTELLHITKLPRKTLSLRLKELCENGALVKNEGVYKLNGISEFENTRRTISSGLSRVLNDRRMRTGLMLVAFLLCSSASGYVLAMFVVPPRDAEKAPPPVALGSFTMSLDVNNVHDLAAWEAYVVFNPAEVTVKGTSAGGFFELGANYLEPVSNVYGDTLAVGGCLLGGEPGKDGSGRLATIVFEYYVMNYKPPELTRYSRGMQTDLMDSVGNSIPVNWGETLVLQATG